MIRIDATSGDRSVRRRACEACNRKKTKCDMNRPACGLCRRTHTMCTYPPNQRVTSDVFSPPVNGGLFGDPNVTSGLFVPPAKSSSTWNTSDFVDQQTNISGSHNNIPSSDTWFPDQSMAGLDTSGYNVTDTLAHELVGLFFSKVQPWLPIFHKPRFYRDYMRDLSNSAWRHPDNKAPEERLLFFSIFALAARFSSSPELMDHPPCDRGDHFAHEANHLMRRSVESSNILFLQGTVLLTYYYYIMGPPLKAWMFVGAITRLAYDLELQQIDRDGSNNYTASGDWVRQEELRRLWWLVWELDIFGSTMSNRPFSINCAETHVYLPVSDEQWFSEIPISSAPLLLPPESAWKSLDGCENNGERAWFIVANYLASSLIKSDPESQEEAIVTAAMNCFRLNLPLKFQLSMEEFVDIRDPPSRNWIICTHLVLLGAKTVRKTTHAIRNNDVKLFPLKNFVHELNDILEVLQIDRIGIFHPFLTWTLISSEALRVHINDSSRDRYVSLGIDMAKKVLERVSHFWSIGSAFLDMIRLMQKEIPASTIKPELLRRFSLLLPRDITTRGPDRALTHHTTASSNNEPFADAQRPTQNAQHPDPFATFVELLEGPEPATVFERGNETIQHSLF